MKSIEEKVDIFLDAPQKETVMHFKSAMIRIENNLYEEAYEKLNSIIDKGTTALVYSDRKDISLDAFKEIINITKILVIANILYFSYDKGQKLFHPFEILPSNKKNAICNEIVELLKSLENLKEKVDEIKKIKKYIKDSKKKYKLQDPQDGILSVAYPYVRFVSIYLQMLLILENFSATI